MSNWETALENLGNALMRLGEALEQPLDEKNMNRDATSINPHTTMEEYHGISWPTYRDDTICIKNGVCYWQKPGYEFDAHHLIPQSHGGPNVGSVASVER